MRLFVPALAALICLPLFFYCPAGAGGSCPETGVLPLSGKIDSSFHTRCAYLVVPENRKKNNGKFIKLPFIVVEALYCGREQESGKKK